MSDAERERLLSIFEALDAGAREGLLEFAEFLLARHGGVDAGGVRASEQPGDAGAAREIPRPKRIPRPENEAVVAAIKRLRRTYPMLDRNKMLNQVYTLMNQHVVEGRSAREVIDELEHVFEQAYRALTTGRDEMP